MSMPKRFHSLTFKVISFLLIGGILTACNPQANPPEAQSNEEQVTETNNTFCPMESRNWRASIDRVAEDEPRLNISGEVDLPTPGYKAEWQPGILDRRNPPSQRISISFIPSEGVVAQVITPTEVSFTMRSPILKYSSVAIYCDDKLLTDIPDVIPSE
ncbi:MAG: hypothetical protein AAGE96_23610 [Cyanobacteria bacterium P01_G01_bin.19]